MTDVRHDHLTDRAVVAQPAITAAGPRLYAGARAAGAAHCRATLRRQSDEVVARPAVATAHPRRDAGLWVAEAADRRAAPRHESDQAAPTAVAPRLHAATTPDAVSSRATTDAPTAWPQTRSVSDVRA